MSNDDKLSKTRRKQLQHELQAIGEELVEISEARLASLDLPERLLDAVMDARRITAHEARRRQMQYIGKIMRVVDPAPIRTALEGWRTHAHRHTLGHKQVEAWRERLISDPDSIAELLAEHPGADARALRALAEGAVRERANGQPPRSYRALYQALRAVIEKEG
jgi:ribosome-associated protein